MITDVSPKHFTNGYNQGTLLVQIETLGIEIRVCF